MQCKERLEAYLREQQIPFQGQPHPKAFQAQQIAEREHIPGKMVAKVVIAFADNKMIALVLPATLRISLDKAQTHLGVKEVRLAHEHEFAATFPDCEVGTMPPFGNLYGLPVYVEPNLAKQEIIVFPVGTSTDTMSLRYRDFAQLVHPTVMDFAHTSSLA